MSHHYRYFYKTKIETNTLPYWRPKALDTYIHSPGDKKIFSNLVPGNTLSYWRPKALNTFTRW